MWPLASNSTRLSTKRLRSGAPVVHRVTAVSLAKTASKLADWMENNVPESLTVLGLPARHRVRMRTSNMLERLNRELKRRTRVVSIFPNDAALLRLASAMLLETDEGWMSGHKYLTMET